MERSKLKGWEEALAAIAGVNASLLACDPSNAVEMKRLSVVRATAVNQIKDLGPCPPQLAPMLLQVHADGETAIDRLCEFRTDAHFSLAQLRLFRAGLTSVTEPRSPLIDIKA
jgi:hypothetical protein